MLTILDVIKSSVSILKVENDRLTAIDNMLEYIKETISKDTVSLSHECVHVSDLEIHIYVRNIGYVTSSKNIHKILKIISYDGYYGALDVDDEKEDK